MGRLMSIMINMDKARDIHLTVIRAARDDELVRLDTEYIRALEAGDTDSQAAIANMKQILRDIPQTIDLSMGTPDELRSQWPEIFKKG